MLIHRGGGEAFAFSDPVPHDEPGKTYYKTKVEVTLGDPLPLPDPLPALRTPAPPAGA
ncbi:hypothetical protein GCM10009801_25570 [Streptomyces albiaxialis]|uniref:Uncharacterized protein n=1 Tax=Streptomyces albiaxialis TaxID=329523 RepID=A0ABN2VUF1_9ACTN